MSFKFNSNDSSINVPNSVPSIERHVAQVTHASHLKIILRFLYREYLQIISSLYSLRYLLGITFKLKLSDSDFGSPDFKFVHVFVKGPVLKKPNS